MKFSKGDVVRRVLPSGTMVGGLMVVTFNAGGEFTAVRDVSTGKYYIDRSRCLGKEGKTTKIMISESDMDKIDATKGVGVFYHIISPVYDKLYANPSRFVCFVLANKGKTIHRVFKLGEVSRVLRKVDEIRKGYEMVPVKQPMYKLQLIGEL
nr:MAG TPA: hypothetical protein [Bacteriophage sp.]